MLHALASALLFASASPPKLHLRLPAESCVARAQLEPSLTARMPGVAIAADDSVQKGDRVVVIAAAATGFHLEVREAGGARLLSRELPSDCAAVSELAAAVLDRHFAEVSWPEEAPELSLPSEPAPEIDLYVPPWEGVALVGAGVDPFGAPLGFSAEVWARRRWFQLGGQLTLGLRGAVDVRVDGRTRGQILSQPLGAAAFAAGCFRPWLGYALCGGPALGAVIIFAGVSGGLYQQSSPTFVRPAPGATASFDYAVSSRLLVGFRASALAPLPPVRLFVEGSTDEKTHSVQALAALNIGWSFL